MNSYFSHDSNAKKDPKILKVRMKYGAAGYGIYFMILEDLRDEEGYSMAADFDVIAFGLREDAETIKDIVTNFDLFKFTDDGKRFYSESLNKRMAIKDEISKKKSDAGKKGASNRWNNKNSSEDGTDNGTAITEDMALPFTQNSNAIPGAMAQPSKNNGTAMAQPSKIDSTAIAQPSQNDGTPNATAMALDGNKSKVNKSKSNQSKGNESKLNIDIKNSPVEQKSADFPPSASSDFKSVIDQYKRKIDYNVKSRDKNELEKRVNRLVGAGTTYTDATNIVRLAIDVTARYQVKNINYVTKILDNWDKQELYTLSDVLDYVNPKKKDKPKFEHIHFDDDDDALF